jgi:membrane associated rhomboid family serine protease
VIPFSDPSQPNRIFPFVNMGIAHWAHIGGFIAGAILIWFFRHPTKVDQMRTFHAGAPGG